LAKYIISNLALQGQLENAQNQQEELHQRSNLRVLASTMQLTQEA
jgi:hypothetical protein